MIRLMYSLILVRMKATFVPSGDHDGCSSFQPLGGWAIWLTWLPSGFIAKIAALV